MSNPVVVSQLRSDVALMTLDMPGTAANVLTAELFAELDRQLAELQQRTELQGLIVVSAKPRIFVAGADLKAIVATLDWPDEQIVDFCQRGRAVFRRLSACPFVTVAAIHGACVGGGLELTLWCDRRVAADDRVTVLGLPEVKLGLVPGWAGTVRLPRLAGLENAIDLVTSGRLVSAKAALAMGFVDRVAAAEQLVDEALQLIDDARDQDWRGDRQRMSQPLSQPLDSQSLSERFGNSIVENRDLYPFAPTVALEHILRTATLTADQAMQSEAEAMAQVYGSPASYGLLNHFYLVEHNKKQPGAIDPDARPAEVERIGIVGAGLMGGAIAEKILNRGKTVLILDAAVAAAEQQAQALSQSGTIRAASDYRELADCQLVIESVVETADVKKSVLAKVEAVVAPETVLATNTSAIPIARLAAGLQHSSRFCGIHFCHPQLMSLVEVVRGQDSSAETVATAVGLVRSLRMMPLVVRDGPGFVVNRLLAAMVNQALGLFGRGQSIADIDSALREFGFHGGPFEIVDTIGMDTCLYVGKIMWDQGVDCVTLSPVIPKLVKHGRLGRKTGQGFYRYDDQSGPSQADDQLLELIGPYQQPAAATGPASQSEPVALAADEIVECVLSAAVLEASRLLEEGIVADSRDIDLASIHGLSFPAWQGGLLFWADRHGIALVNQRLEKLGAVEPRLCPTARLREMEQLQQRFYS